MASLIISGHRSPQNVQRTGTQVERPGRMTSARAIAHMLLELARANRQINEHEEWAKAMVAATLLQFGSGNVYKPRDVSVARAWANELVEAIADYAAQKALAARTEPVATS